MKKRSFLIMVLTLTFLLTSSLPASAWYGSIKYATDQDVHLTDTYWWARDMGFSDSEAKNISKHCDSVDAGIRFYDKTWHLDRSYFTGDSIDTRQKHADEEMAKAKYYISKVPGAGKTMAKWYRSKAHEHLGHGLHALQDIYGHMDAGVGKAISYKTPASHGMEGIKVDATDVDGTVSQVEVELLYDDVFWDYTPDEGWHRHKTKEDSTRWLNTKEASKQYMYEFLQYGYGPGK